MTKMKKYVFRDDEVFLEMLDTGTRSQFIREAIELKIKISKKTCEKELAENNELIKYYTNRINTYDEEIEDLNQEKTKITQLKNKAKSKLEKLVHEQNNKKSLQQQKDKEAKDERILQTRKTIIEEIIYNMIQQKENKTTRPLNMSYLTKKGEYENIKELKKEVIDYIHNLEYDPVNKEISENDVEYLKNKTRSDYNYGNSG